MSRNDLVLFMHIPKSGGTTSRSILQQHLSPAHIFDCYWAQPGKTVDDLIWLDDEERDRIRLVYGHFFYGIHHLFQRRHRYVTVIRDPIERVVSQFYHQKRHHELCGVPSQSSDEEALENVLSRMDFQYDNLATRMISGYGPRRVPAEQMLERALGNLRRDFCYVGTVPGDGVSGAAYAALNVHEHPQPSHHSLNVGENKTVLRASSHDMIRHYNKADCALFDFVR